MLHKDEFDGNLVMGGAEFHRRSHRTNVAKTLREKKYTRFFDYSSGNPVIIDEAFDILSACPVCGSNDLIVGKVVKDGMSIDECKSCCFGFQNPRVKRSYLKYLYTKEGTHNFERYASEGNRKIDRVKNLFELINQI